MEYFTEEHAKLLLSKEWLVKVDADKSVPYLMKFYQSPADLSCVLMITDTKTVWAEVMSSNQLFRRWCDANKKPVHSASHGDEWKDLVLQLLSDAHSLGGLPDLSFEAVPSHYSDFAFELQHDTFKWRWETLLVGPKLSAELLSRQLILPLVSTAHLAFTSADLVGELADGELEKAVDKVGRTARRTVDTHIRNALMRPKLATTLRRLTALLDFAAAPPPIRSEAEKPDLAPPPSPPPERAAVPRPHAPSRESHSDRSSPPPPPHFSARQLPPPATSPHDLAVRAMSVDAPPENPFAPPAQSPARTAPAPGPHDDDDDDDDSVTEAESDEAGPAHTPQHGKGKEPASSASPPPSKKKRSHTPPPRVPSPTASSPGSDAPSERRAPQKKAKTASSSSDESDAPRGAAARRGTRQPIRRGGRRF